MEILKTPKEVAEILGITYNTLAVWRSKSRGEGKGPPWIKIGSSVRYDSAELEKWLQERTVRPGEKG